MQSDLTFSFHRAQRQRFRDGDLVREWRARFPQLFDLDDERVLNTSHQRRYHFFEWLAAVLLFELTGLLSMVEKYSASSHPEKLRKVRELISPEMVSWLSANESGQADLLVYSPVTGDWFFCEVKGPGDRVRVNQTEWRDRLYEKMQGEGLSTNGRYRTLCLNEWNF